MRIVSGCWRAHIPECPPAPAVWIGCVVTIAAALPASGKRAAALARAACAAVELSSHEGSSLSLKRPFAGANVALIAAIRRPV